MNERARTLIRELRLRKHPEGGFYRETYRSEKTIPAGALPGQYGGDRAMSTGIYFLLVHPEISMLHRLKSDELWHFYEGSPVKIHMIAPGEPLRDETLGPGIQSGESYQVCIRAGTWFAAEVAREGSYTLVGCTVAPGFDFNDFELGASEDLLNNYPELSDFIMRFTPQVRGRQNQ